MGSGPTRFVGFLQIRASGQTTASVYIIQCDFFSVFEASNENLSLQYGPLLQISLHDIGRMDIGQIYCKRES